MRIKEKCYHLKGTPKESEVFKTITNNYLSTRVTYEKGRGYYMVISRMGKYTYDYGDGTVVMEAFRLADPSPHLFECLVPCTRAGKAREREAVKMFDENILSAITKLGYEIEED